MRHTIFHNTQRNLIYFFQFLPSALPKGLRSMELLNEKQHILLVKLRRIPQKLALGKYDQIYFHQKIIIPISFYV